MNKTIQTTHLLANTSRYISQLRLNDANENNDTKKTKRVNETKITIISLNY